MKSKISYAEAFKPLKLEITIENEDELLELYHHTASEPYDVQWDRNNDIPRPSTFNNLSGLKYILGIYCKRREEGAEDD